MNTNELLEKFEKLTDELISLDITKDTDELIEQIEEKLSKRDLLLEKITSEGRDDKTEVILSRIMQKDNQLKTKFLEIKLNISDSISKVVSEKKLSSTKKRANRGYLNVGKQTDGYFIDKKK